MTLTKASGLELLDSALPAPQAGFGDEDIYPSIEQAPKRRSLPPRRAGVPNENGAMSGLPHVVIAWEHDS
jgi:hypothetical protein